MPMSFSRPVRVALDAMGGDYAPAHEVEGAVLAIRDAGPLLDLTLVGDEPKLRQEMGRVGAPDTLKVVQASQVITMEDPPTAALKLKRDSSLAVGMRYHQEGRVDAFVSAGNTGAVLSASTLILGRVKGVSRPTIGTFIPAHRGGWLLLDAGTNVACRAHPLFEFAVMGSIYAKRIIKYENPGIGLLNVGEEGTKGNEIAKETFKLLKNSSLNFLGNVEGRDILKGTAPVVVWDG